MSDGIKRMFEDMDRPRSTKIYVAASWRNEHQPAIVRRLRAEGHEVYDYRDPDGAGHNTGFHWSDIDPEWERWTHAQFREALKHPLAQLHFNKDFGAMEWADVLVMVMPSGNSAHLEAGWATGKKPTAILLLGDVRPELMYKQADFIAISMDEIVNWIERIRR